MIPADLHPDKTILFSFLERIENLGRNSCKLRSQKLTRYLINDTEINIVRKILKFAFHEALISYNKVTKHESAKRRTMSSESAEYRKYMHHAALKLWLIILISLVNFNLYFLISAGKECHF